MKNTSDESSTEYPIKWLFGVALLFIPSAFWVAVYLISYPQEAIASVDKSMIIFLPVLVAAWFGHRLARKRK